eukprot:6815386-Prorocentrum_lima.AAC.1
MVDCIAADVVLNPSEYGEHFLWQAATSKHDGAALTLGPSLALPRLILAYAATSEKHATMLQFMRR